MPLFFVISNLEHMLIICFNQVYALGSGLVQTGTGAATGLTDTAKAPFAGSTQKADTGSVQGAIDDEAAMKKGPRKIEVRNGQPVDVSGKDGQDGSTEAVEE
jgi:hypothetical protein